MPGTPGRSHLQLPPGLVTAWRTLTVLPLPGRDAERFSDALPWFPPAGGLLAMLLYIPLKLFEIRQGPWPMGEAAFLLAGAAALSGGIHLDGLADWADSLGARGDRERALAIMKDSRVGSFGVMALVLVLMLKFVALVQLTAVGTPGAWVGAVIAARTVQVGLSVCLPYARTGTGTAAPFVTGAGTRHLLWALVLMLPLCATALSWCLAPLWLLLFTALVVSIAFGAHCRRSFGGITGDLLGAASELTETACLVVPALMAR